MTELRNETETVVDDIGEPEREVCKLITKLMGFANISTSRLCENSVDYFFREVHAATF